MNNYSRPLFAFQDPPVGLQYHKGVLGHLIRKEGSCEKWTKVSPSLPSSTRPSLPTLWLQKGIKPELLATVPDDVISVLLPWGGEGSIQPAQASSRSRNLHHTHTHRNIYTTYIYIYIRTPSCGAEDLSLNGEKKVKSELRGWFVDRLAMEERSWDKLSPAEFQQLQDFAACKYIPCHLPYFNQFPWKKPRIPSNKERIICGRYVLNPFLHTGQFLVPKLIKCLIDILFLKVLF